MKEVTDWILEKPRAGLCIPGCTTGVSIAAGSLASHWKDRFQCPDCPRWHAHAQGVVLDDDDSGGGGDNDVTGRPTAARKEIPEALLVRTTPSALGCAGASESVPRDVVTPEDSVDDDDDDEDDGAVEVNTSSLSSTAAEEEEGEEEEEVGGSSTTSSSCKVKTT